MQRTAGKASQKNPWVTKPFTMTKLELDAFL
jgi:hypothetical protein